ncbi:MAG: quinolinate synthase [Succinivibrio sp.]
MPLHMIENVTVPSSFDLPKRMDAESRKKDALLFDKALELIKKKNALLIAHYYTSDTMQRLCEAAGGFIGDSLEMARMGRDSDKELIIVAGVRFMGETAKILSPEKTVIMPDLKAECSLDLCCRAEDLRKVKELYPGTTVVAYANTSAEVKAEADWIVTSSLAVELGKYLTKQGKPIVWVPDRHLGSYIANQSDCDVYCWPGRCIVHDAFEANAIDFVKKEHPKAKLLVHPEAPANVVEMADYVGSTSQILNYTKVSSDKEFIIATERNIFYKLSSACPDKTFIEAPVGSREGFCISCANCPWMELNTLEKLIGALDDPLSHVINVDENLRLRSLKPLERMLEFSAALKSGEIVL